MKIFFSGSIRGGREDVETYAGIISILSVYGEVLNKHVGDKSISQLGDSGPTSNIHKREIARMIEADVVVAEVTIPSLGVGYEIAKAEEMDKKILCLYREIGGRSISAMVSGSKKLTLKKYSSMINAKEIFEKFCINSGISLK